MNHQLNTFPSSLILFNLLNNNIKLIDNILNNLQSYMFIIL